MLAFKYFFSSGFEQMCKTFFLNKENYIYKVSFLSCFMNCLLELLATVSSWILKLLVIFTVLPFLTSVARVHFYCEGHIGGNEVNPRMGVCVCVFKTEQHRWLSTLYTVTLALDYQFNPFSHWVGHIGHALLWRQIATKNMKCKNFL
jgi:hypothetical protein